MNTWIVGNHPIGHHQYDYHNAMLAKIAPNRLVSTSRTELEQEEYGDKVFFMKGRIMAGQADMQKNEYEDQEYAWLAKEEVADKVGLKYWSSIRNMLVER
jgi:large subunit ribosomal protein L46